MGGVTRLGPEQKQIVDHRIERRLVRRRVVTRIAPALIILLAVACGSTRAQVEEPTPAPSDPDAGPSEPASSSESEPEIAATSGAPDTAEECAAAHPELGQCRWSVEVVGFSAPCCGTMGSGPVCVCNTCESDADCGRGARCRELQSRMHQSATTTAHVCVARRDPCFDDAQRCGGNRYCAHDDEGHASCFDLRPAPP